MNRTAIQSNGMHWAGYFGPARVLHVDEEKGLIRIRLDVAYDDLDQRRGAKTAWARPALPCDCELGWGDRVLVAGDLNEDFYVVGMLNVKAQGRVRARRILLESGARAEAHGIADKERLKVFSTGGEMIFEHDPASGKSRVNVPSGDLEVLTRNGNLDFIAAGGVRFFSKAAIEMKSLQGVRMATANAGCKTISTLDLKPGRVDIKSAEIGISARKGDLQLDETAFSGKRFSGAIAHVKLTMQRCETIAESVIARAKNVYRTVDELTQLKTGRLRMLVDRTYQLMSKTSILKAKEDFKIDGEKIHLG